MARKIAVCLSGGGTRAASFSAGVLHAMAEQEMLQDVVLYCSTSGGSITNAFIGTRLAFANQAIGPDKAAFLADQLRKYNYNLGRVAVSPYSRSLRTRLSPFVLLIPLIAIVSTVAGLSMASRTGQLFALLISVSIALWALDLVGGHSMRELEGRLRDGLNDVMFNTSDARGVFLDDAMRGSPAEHVFVATDVTTYDPVYVARDSLVIEGEREVCPVLLLDAVIDTMRFPGYLSPRGVKVPRLVVGAQLQDNTPGRWWKRARMLGRAEGVVYLADGGIVDNHATSYLLRDSVTSSLDMLVSICADRGLPSSSVHRYTARGRLRALTNAIRGVHAKASRSNLDHIRRLYPDLAVVTVSLPSGSGGRTSLGRVRRRKGRSAFEIGQDIAHAEFAHWRTD